MKHNETMINNEHIIGSLYWTFHTGSINQRLDDTGAQICTMLRHTVPSCHRVVVSVNDLPYPAGDSTHDIHDIQWSIE